MVEFILDLIDYRAERDLRGSRLLEPACGTGQFLLVAVERLLDSYLAHGGTPGQARHDLRHAVLAVELHKATLAETRARLIATLTARAIPAADAGPLVADWLIQDDFLLAPITGTFTHVVGNPPYVRHELIPEVLMAAYRARYDTIYDRADLYIPFLQRSLTLLAPGGQLGCICADRWMKNRYGGPLRRMIAEGFHLKVYVDMVDTPAFHSEVSAYPAITIIAREAGTRTRIAHRPALTRPALAALATALTAAAPRDAAVRSLDGVAHGAEPWVLEFPDQLALVRRLEADFPALEAAGCTVGIGVATGADAAFIAPFADLSVEADRKLPLVTTRDIATGRVEWHGLGVINPFTAEGRLVPLDAYPRLKQYLEAHQNTLTGRHVARKNPTQWYRTIDRIDPALTARPKLLIPDIKGAAHIVYEGGQFYPHHNLYYITSATWDLEVLQAVLRSGIARLFVATYSTRMRGGYLRFQAQYLRRIRVPHWHQVPAELQQELQAAARVGNWAACPLLVAALYNLTPVEQAALGGE